MPSLSAEKKQSTHENPTVYIGTREEAQLNEMARLNEAIKARRCVSRCDDNDDDAQDDGVDDERGERERPVMLMVRMVSLRVSVRHRFLAGKG